MFSPKALSLEGHTSQIRHFCRLGSADDRCMIRLCIWVGGRVKGEKWPIRRFQSETEQMLPGVTIGVLIVPIKGLTCLVSD